MSTTGQGTERQGTERQGTDSQGGTVPRTPAARRVDVAELDRLVGGAHPDPHGVLGAHVDGATLTIRALRPFADSVTAVLRAPGSPVVELPLTHEHEGVWVGATSSPVPGEVPDYRLVVSRGGVDRVEDDPYRYLPTLGGLDLHLVGEGRHEQLWEVLGANHHTYSAVNGPVTGTSFAVWAPNARGVRVVGDFNRWDARVNPLRSLGSSGVWELFVPGVGTGDFYKFEVLGADSVWRTKADPLAKWTGVAPDTASRVFTSQFAWSDDAWFDKLRGGNPYREPMSIYEVHLGSWRHGLDYPALATELVDYVVEQGFTHVEFLPVAEHPFGGSWGYQVTSYYAPMAGLGNPDDFRLLVDRLHAAGIGVIVDWVPGHFPRDQWALARFDGTPLYEHPDPRRGEQPDWGTYVFDFGRHEVRNFLVANALYWLAEFHVDGLRVDAVASMLYLDYSRAEGEWVPNAFGGRENLEAVSFLQEANATVYRRHPTALMIAEESTAWPGVTRSTDSGGLGFGFKWNMGWMHDSLAYIAEEPIYRQYHHGRMTFSMVYAYSENFILPISHDEVVHGKGSLLGKMPGDRWRQFANLRAYLGYMWAHPGKQLLFMGSELGQYREWSESRGLDWDLLQVAEHAGVQRLVRDLNTVYRASPALFTADHQPTGFSWIDADDASANVLSFLRFGSDGSMVAAVSNFSPVPHHAYRIGLPRAGRWTEVLNSDAELYGGSGVGNHGSIAAIEQEWFGFPASASVVLPPLASVWFRRDAD